MRAVSFEVPDALADQIERASERERLVWSFRLASIVAESSGNQQLVSTLADIQAWQGSGSRSDWDFESVFAELVAED